MITSKSHERARIGGKKKLKHLEMVLLILIGMIKLFFKKEIKHLSFLFKNQLNYK